MKFGYDSQVSPTVVDFTLPDRNLVIEEATGRTFQAWVGLPKWNKDQLKGFYPKGVKEELAYYSTQFNSIELTPTFYRFFPESTFKKWKDETPADFKFFPKLEQTITHLQRLKDVETTTDSCIERYSVLGDKLGVTLMQMHNNYTPLHLESGRPSYGMERVVNFLEYWNRRIPLAIEFRHTDWHNDPAVSKDLYALLKEYGVANVLVDTSGRRDLMHMHLTTDTAYIRWVGANFDGDYKRLDDWADRIASWKAQGLRELYFFVHTHSQKDMPQLAQYFIKKLNETTGTNILIPTLQD